MTTNCTCHPGTTCTSASQCATARELHFGAPAAEVPEAMTRFCPGCGSVGPVPDTFKDCCPDGVHARDIPEPLAQRCRDLFYLALEANTAAEPKQSTRLRGGVPTEAQIVAAARTLNKLSANSCNVDEADQWALYGNTFRAEAKAALESALTAAPQAPALDAGVVRDAWRLLETGDRIESADEVLHDDCVTWGSLVGWEVGATYNTTLFMPIRRKVLAAMSAQGGA